MTTGLSLFNTTVGNCGIAWNAVGIIGVQLPETQGLHQTRSRLVKLFPESTEQTPATYFLVKPLHTAKLL
jgi:methylated-DNA-[protein]-cysteine S-methyltransferase